jgi:hypothetical protein
MAQQATERALETAEAERQALAQVMSQLADADAVQTSIIVRNLTTSKGINVDQEGRLRGRANVIVTTATSVTCSRSWSRSASHARSSIPTPSSTTRTSSARRGPPPCTGVGFRA